MEKDETPLASAVWIRSSGQTECETNTRYEFRRCFSVGTACRARVSITADSRYRLWVNGAWMSDGPARSYAGQAWYDSVDVELRAGENLVEVELLYWGVDTFQYQRGLGGLIVAVHSATDKTPLLVTDTQWQARRASAWMRRVPRISCQQGFEEHYDATVEPCEWEAAVMAPECERELRPRETDLLGRRYRGIETLVKCEHVREISGGWSFSLRMLFSPFPRGINLNGMAGALRTRLRCDRQTSLCLHFLGSVDAVFVDGEAVALKSDFDVQECELLLEAGDHRLGVSVCTENYQSTELAIGWESVASVYWENEYEDSGEPWLTSGPLWGGSRDTNCFMDRDGPEAEDPLPFRPPFGGTFLPQGDGLRRRARSLASDEKAVNFRPMHGNELHVADAYLSIRTDRVVEDEVSPDDVLGAGACLLYDLGEVTVGYLELEFEAEDGASVDVYCFEHIQDGQIQYLYQNGCISYRNSLRYKAHTGRNVFCSRQRRGFRYVQVVCRGAPISQFKLGVYESTYQPVQYASFECSDDRLNRIFAVSQRTLLLCMEDTFTDCPSFEQAYWLGDARNEALFARCAFGASELVEHSLRLAADSLSSLPLVASQCPSGWDVIIPSFSFLWGIAVWESYWENGYERFLRELYPAVKQNIGVALSYCTDRGLFSARAWNFLDWTGIDQERETVLHNSILLAAALESGVKIARVLGEDSDADEFLRRRSELAAAIDDLWDSDAEAYRDARLPDGSLSDKVCQHTSFLAVLFGVVAEDKREAALKNCLRPPDGMTRVGSPNAMFFLLETMLREGYAQETLEHLRTFWGEMLDAGATTFWEMINPEGSAFPTRSHCHGWSSAPVYLLPQLFFDIKCLEPGWRRVEIRPRALGLDFARVSLCTPHGPLKLEWKRSANGKIETHVQAPPEINLNVLEPL